MKDFFRHRYSLPIIVISALLLVIIAVKLKPDLKHNPDQMPARLVEFIYAQHIPHRAKATAYGEVKPTTLLQANAEVSGKIVYLHPQLKAGSVLPKDTLVLKIDQTNYQLALAQAKADLAANKAALSELEIQQQNTTTSLKIAQRRLNLGEKELKRKKNLLTQGSISQSSVDNEEKIYWVYDKKCKTSRPNLRCYQQNRKWLWLKLRPAKHRFANGNKIFYAPNSACHSIPE